MLDITPIEFENICKELVKKMGFEAETTKASGDGGIDVLAYNYQPLISGKYIIQCKRYSGSVGEPILRDLYGSVMSLNANKGILITTGVFTKSAVEFAEGKQLELIDGGVLERLLEQYDIKVGEGNAECSNYMNGFVYADEYEMLNNYLLENPKDSKIRLKMVAFLNEHMRSSTFEGVSDELVYWAKLCLKHIDKIYLPQDNVANIMRKIVIEFIRGNMLFVLGNISDAYRSFSGIVASLKGVSEKNENNFELQNCINDIRMDAIYNIWLIRDILGINNIDFYQRNKEVIDLVSCKNKDYMWNNIERCKYMDNPDEQDAKNYRKIFEWYMEEWESSDIRYMSVYGESTFGGDKNPIYDIYGENGEWERPVLRGDLRVMIKGAEIKTFFANYWSFGWEYPALKVTWENTYFVDYESEKKKILLFK